MGEVRFDAAAFGEFLNRYADFMWEMCESESDMLAAVARGDIPAMEKGMNLSGADQKRMAKFEADRQALQSAADCGGGTLRQAIDKLDAAERTPLYEALDRFEAGVLRLRFLNAKAMETTKMSIAVMDEEERAVLAAVEKPNGDKAGSLERSI